MDNTGLHYLTYDPDAIWDQMIISYVDAGGDILYPGDEKEMLLRSVLADIVQVFAGVDNALRMATLRYAVGDYLDLIGQNRGCLRIQASKATALVTITANATGETGTLAAGTSMTADGVLHYLLVEDLTLTGEAQTATVAVISDREGSEGNALLATSAMFLENPNPAISSIVAATNATGGNAKEADEDYRERIRNFELTNIRTGTKRQYESVVKSVSSDIVDAVALTDDDEPGQVNIYLLLASGATAASVIDAVEEELSKPDVKALTDKIVVDEATAVTYTINVNYTCDNSGAVTSAIAKAAQDYQDWQDSTIGLAFNPDRLMAAIYQAGATRVVWGNGSEFDSGTVEYTEIEANEYCSGTITLTAV